MSEDFKAHLKRVKFENYLKKLNKKLKNKKVIVYGSGTFFKYIKDNYDLSGLNIIGISDLKFDINQEGEDCLGYKIIPKSRILSYKPDIILVATLRYIGIVEDFEINILNKTNVRVYPFAKLPFWELVKEIWSKTEL